MASIHSVFGELNVLCAHRKVLLIALGSNWNIFISERLSSLWPPPTLMFLSGGKGRRNFLCSTRSFEELTVECQTVDHVFTGPLGGMELNFYFFIMTFCSILIMEEQ